MEQWRTLPFSSSYQVSDKGRICKKEKLMSPTIINGYLRASIHGRRHMVHRLVALTYSERVMGEKSHLTEINHVNGIKTNNEPENLEWVTRSENAIHARRAGLQPQGNWVGENAWLEIMQILHRDPRADRGELAKKFNCGKRTIQKTIYGDDRLKILKKFCRENKISVEDFRSLCRGEK